MDIDPKELRIASHYYNGGYVKPIIGRITAIYGSVYRPEEMNVGLIYDMPLDEDSDPYEHTMAINLEPIPITEELLTELGFELNEDWNKCMRGSKRLENLDGFIQFKKLDSEFDNLWEMIVGVENGRYQLTQCLFVRYIHEAEQFLYLTTKQELIND